MDTTCNNDCDCGTVCMVLEETDLEEKGDPVTPVTKNDMKTSTQENIIRASTMRLKIEEKISDIEKKINVLSPGFKTDSPVDGSCDVSLFFNKSGDISVESPVTPIRQGTIEQLQLKLKQAEKDLQVKKKEIIRLTKIRDEAGSEIEDLTASLFEEANKMVCEAKKEQDKAEKYAKELIMQLGVLQEELGALKLMIQSFSQCQTNTSVENVKTEENIMSSRHYEVDPEFHNEFILWRQNPCLSDDTSFMKVILEDAKDCLKFKNLELSKIVLSTVIDDKLIIEKINISQNEHLPKFCALLKAPRYCLYKLYLDDGQVYNISNLSRNRIAAVCDLLSYLRYIERGLISLPVNEVYFEILKKRRRMISARLGLLDDIVE